MQISVDISKAKNPGEIAELIRRAADLFSVAPKAKTKKVVDDEMDDDEEAVTDDDDEEVEASDDDDEDEEKPAPKKRGRPAGAKNKAKETDDEEEEEDSDDDSDGPTLKEVSATINELLERDAGNVKRTKANSETVKSILNRFGVATARKLDKGDYATVIKAIRSAIKKK